MNKIITAIFIILNINTFSQSTFKFKSGGRVTYNDVKMSTDSIRSLMSSSPNALELYNIGRTKKTVANVLLYGGFTLLIGKFYSDSTENTYLGPNQNNIVIVEKSRYPYFIGLAMIITGIPVKIGFSNKIRKALNLANQDLRNPKTSYIESTDLVINSNGLGFQITF